MADLELAFDYAPVAAGNQLAFVEGSMAIGDTTVEIDCGGRVRPAAIAFGTGFEGASITVSIVVPWAAGDSSMILSDITITPSAGEVVALPFSDYFWPQKILLTVNTAQTAAHDIGVFAWRGRVE